MKKLLAAFLAVLMFCGIGMGAMAMTEEEQLLHTRAWTKTWRENGANPTALVKNFDEYYTLTAYFSYEVANMYEWLIRNTKIFEYCAKAEFANQGFEGLKDVMLEITAHIQSNGFAIPYDNVQAKFKDGTLSAYIKNSVPTNDALMRAQLNRYFSPQGMELAQKYAQVITKRLRREAEYDLWADTLSDETYIKLCNRAEELYLAMLEDLELHIKALLTNGASPEELSDLLPADERQKFLAMNTRQQLEYYIDCEDKVSTFLFEVADTLRAEFDTTAPPPTRTIGNTDIEATVWNWILYIVFFGWIWMR